MSQDKVTIINLGSYSKHILFFSDLHLSSVSELKYQAMLKKLDDCLLSDTLTHIFFLGDIFDLWIGNGSSFVKKHEVLIKKIEKLINRKIKIYYFEGNHDLYLKRFWQKKLSVKVCTGPSYFQLDENIVRIEHGDEMDPEDKGYLFLRWLLRSMLMRLVSRLLPSFIIIKIGDYFSLKSRTYTDELKQRKQRNDFTKIIENHLKRQLSHDKFQVSISGHVHQILNQKFDWQGRKITFFNLGSWNEDNYPYLEYKNFNFYFKNLKQ